MATPLKTQCALICASFLLGLGSVWAQTDQASFAVNIFDRQGSMDPVNFDAVAINRLGQLDQDTWRLTIPSAGLYLVSLSAGHPGDGLTDYRLQQGNNTKTAIYRDESNTDRQSILGRDIVTWLNVSDELYVRSNGPRLISSTESLATSWGTFALSGDMGTTIGFGVARSSNFTAGKITFDTVWANDGNGWDINTSVFTVPTTGIYYFSFSTGVTSGNSVEVYLRINNQKVHRIHRSSASTVDVDTFQRAVMLSLFSGDKVEMVSDHNGHSNSDYLTTFSGFMYNTVRPLRLAWSVSRSSSVSGENDPLEFQHVDVNEGSAWQENHAVCYLSGIYYLHVSALTSSNSDFSLTVMLDNRPIGELRHESPDSEETMSRSLMVECSEGQTFKIISFGSINSGDESRDINFMGFYMFL